MCQQMIMYDTVCIWCQFSSNFSSITIFIFAPTVPRQFVNSDHFVATVSLELTPVLVIRLGISTSLILREKKDVSVSER